MNRRLQNLIRITIAGGMSSVVLGCFAPSSANIKLRKELQAQQVEIDQLKREHAADAAGRRALATTGPSSTAALSPELAAALFTTHGIRLGRLTGQDDKGLVIHLIPTDDAGDDLKAAGSITVEAFDLAAEGKRVSAWQFDAAQARSLWNGSGLRYEYVVPCPWTEKPASGQITLKVTFTDALTGRVFDTQQVVAIKS
ncbi:MAG: hypothetical protein JWM57_2905 [Phycisphaerales bacterium]|nr:hypothetical protein [Phycisphaerales bacterium]